MQKTILLLIAIILCLSVNPSWAKEPKEIAQEFFGKIKAGKIDEAYDGLFEGSGIPELKPQAFDMLKRQTASSLPIHGTIINYELIYEEFFGTSLVRLVYLLKHEKVPTIWQFYFYKPDDKWFLNQVLFNDQFQLLQKLK